MSVSVRPRADGPRAMCPYCRELTGEEVTPCDCGVVYHPECRAELSRCATIGCAGKSTGDRRGARRDVACARCSGLIQNDGDMCFGCWSPYHRRCLAAGCCGRRPSEPTDEEKGSFFDHAGLVFGICILMTCLISVMSLGLDSLLWLDRTMAIAGAVATIVIGVGIEVARTRRRNAR